MMRSKNTIFLLSTANLFLFAPAFAEGVSNGLIDAITNGQTHFEARLRYEYVDQTGFANKASATSLRTKLSYQTQKYKSFSGLIEFENISNLFGSKFNDTINGKTNYPIIADPNDTLVNRLYIEYSGIPKTSLVLGRQAINLNNQRHVGAVGWRQNDQTYDAFSVKNTAIPNMEIFYAYANQVNRVFGTKSAQGTWDDSDIHLFNFSFDGKELGKFSLYNYLLDLPDAAALSTKTLGFRYETSIPIDKAKLGFVGEFANQKDYGANNLKVDLAYYSVEPSFSFGNWTLKAQYEFKEGNSVRAFQFPLGTNHAFDGWADKFLTTPANGLIDTNFSIAYKIASKEALLNGMKFSLIYHDFNSDIGSIDYGSEWNALVEQNLGKNVSVGVKYARYEAKGLYTDTTKFMPYIVFKY